MGSEKFIFSINDTTFHKLLDERTAKLVQYKVQGVQHLWQGWEAAYFTYHNEDTQAYIDLLRDIYYNHNLPNGVDEKIEKVLGGLL